MNGSIGPVTLGVLTASTWAVLGAVRLVHAWCCRAPIRGARKVLRDAARSPR